MQKIYSRINWENSPSANTPLGENNLNAMDYALDVIDTRVVGLYGYESRVKESETNAKTSEINAKESELKSKEYMEHAFNTTPDGYGALLSDVTAIGNTASEALAIANGKNRARVFSTTSDMQNYLSNKNNIGVFQVGDNIYIVDVGVPDWWISEVLTSADPATGYYYKIGQLETQKVDLTNYATKSEVNAALQEIDDLDSTVVKKSSIVNNLTSTSTTAPLSANQGKVLSDGKQDKITGAATTITSSNLTASRALVSNSSGKVTVSSVTSTELGYLSGVNNNVQTQLDGVKNYGNIDKLADFTGTSQATITVSDMSAYKQIVLMLLNNNGEVVNTMSIPAGTWGQYGYTVILYGSSSSVWAKAIWTSPTTLSCNRTSSTTQKLSIFGVK